MMAGAHIGQGKRTEWDQYTKNYPGPGSYMGASYVESYQRRMTNPYYY